VERLINRYTNAGDTVYDPFGGLGTTGYVALKLGRKGYVVELSAEYFRDAVGYLRLMEDKVTAPTLFDFEAA
jgi:DNA modification methylase